MINLGMDFGSTYTMVSVLENGEPRTVQSSHLMFHYPSIIPGGYAEAPGESNDVPRNNLDVYNRAVEQLARQYKAKT
ncbi:MAG: hypothetical protein II629_09820, partial [Ruminococcus sp.]|nr:hypothetical protein [Ruminococcus sp.]